MKRPIIDAGEVIRNDFISDISTLHRLRKLWGTTYGPDGTEVMLTRNYYHPVSKRSDSYKKLYKFLGAYDSIEDADVSKIKSGWLTFNKNEATILGDTGNFVVVNMNKIWGTIPDGVETSDVELSTSIVIGGLIGSGTNSPRQTDLLDPKAPKEQLIADIKSKYDQLWDTCRIQQEGVSTITKGHTTNTSTNVVTPNTEKLSNSDPWVYVLAVNALRSTGVYTEIKNVEIGTSTTSSGIYYTYVVDIVIPYKQFFNNSTIVTTIENAINSEKVFAPSSRRIPSPFDRTNTEVVRSVVRAMSLRDLDTGDYSTRDYILFEDEAGLVGSFYDNLWYKHGDTWYLKASAFTDPRSHGISHRDMVSYILSSVQSDYKKKPVPWYKKLVAIIVVVVAIVFAPVSGGSSLKLAAYAILFAATVVGAIAALAAVLGHEEWAGAFAEVSKTMEPLVIIASIVTAGSFVTLLKNEAAKYAAEEMLQFVGDELGSDAELFARVFTADFSMDSLESFLGTLSGLTTLYTNNKLDELRDKNKALQEEADKLQKESTKERDIISSMARAALSPLAIDQSVYAEQFDMPYERGGGPLAMGNIQKTTKTAMRPAKYEEAVFENISLL